MVFPSYRIEPEDHTNSGSMRKFLAFCEIRDIEADAWIRFAAASMNRGGAYSIADHAEFADQMLTQFRHRFIGPPLF